MVPLLIIALILAVNGQATITNRCAAIPLNNNGGKVTITQSMKDTFGTQLTLMSDDLENHERVFSAPRYENNAQVSIVYWSVCETLPPSFIYPGCARLSSCCERMITGEAKTCGLFGNQTELVLDKFLEYNLPNNISFVGGITLKYFSDIVKVPSNYGGLPIVGKNFPMCFHMDVKCAPMIKFLLIPSIDVMYDGENVCLRAKVESQYACVAHGIKFLHLTSWKILFYVVAPAALVAGLLLCFLGWRLFRITSLVLGLFFGLSIAGTIILFSVFLACEATKPPSVLDFWSWSHECTFHYLTANAYVGIIASIAGLLFGLVLAIAAYQKPSFGGILIGMCVGAWMSDYLYVTTFSVLKQHWIVLLLSALFIPLFAILGACLPNSWKRSFFIIIIAMTGAYLFCWGIGAYTRFFPSLVLLEELGPRWQYYVFTAGILLMGLMGALTQFFVTGQFDWDTLMESGLCPARGNRRRVGKAREETLLSTVSSSSGEDIEMEAKVKNIVKEINDVEK